MGLAVVSLIVVAIFGAVAGLVLFRVFGAAAARNPAVEGGEDRGSVGGGIEQLGPLVGAGAAVLGILLGVIGAVVAFSENTIDSAVPAASMGIVMGLVGYFLGARGRGRAAVVVAAVALMFGLMVSQGMVLGGRTDGNLPAVETGAGH